MTEIGGSPTAKRQCPLLLLLTGTADFCSEGWQPRFPLERHAVHRPLNRNRRKCHRARYARRGVTSLASAAPQKGGLREGHSLGLRKRQVPATPEKPPSSGSSRTRRWETNPYQTTSAIEQFNPDPIPSIATRFPFTSLPVSVSFDSAIAIDAGPTLPNSGNTVSTFFGSIPRRSTNAAVCTRLI